MGGEGAATWGHMKVSCSGVPILSIQGVRSQLFQGWGRHMWGKVLWTPCCAGLRAHTLIALLASQKASCRASPPPSAPQEPQSPPNPASPLYPMPTSPTRPIPTHNVAVEGDTVGVEELDDSQEDLGLHIAQDEGSLGWDAAGGVLAACQPLAKHSLESLAAARQHTAVRKHLLLLPAHHECHVTVRERGP